MGCAIGIHYAVGKQYAVGVSAKRSTHTVDLANIVVGTVRITLKNSCYKSGIFCLTKHLHSWNRAGMPFTFGNFKSYLTGSLLAIIANRREWDRCKNISIPQLRLLAVIIFHNPLLTSALLHR